MSNMNSSKIQHGIFEQFALQFKNRRTESTGNKRNLDRLDLNLMFVPLKPAGLNTI